MKLQNAFTSAARSRGLRMLAGAAVVSVILGWALPPATSGQAQPTERLCDSAYLEQGPFPTCRDQILYWINNEPPTGGIDVSFWFMTDQRYTQALAAAKKRGVPIRVLLDLRADANYPSNASRRQELINAGIPIRHKTTTGINHWKMMLYKGDLTPPSGYPALPPRVHFSGANFANGAYSPEPITEPYQNYVDEVVYFTDDEDVVQTFMTKYDDIWLDTVHFKNLANVGPDLLRSYPIYPLSPDLNFPPDADYQDRVVARLRQEPTGVDAVMFRITSGKIPDELIKRVQAGVEVRLITDQNQYRNTSYFWHSYNIDRMYMAGVDVKWKDDATGQDMHQKSLVLHGIETGAAIGMGIVGSSNWTSSSSDTQREHNYFTTKSWFIDWLKDQFNRKWNNRKAAVDGGGPVTPPMYLDFVPEYPETPVYVAPTNQALGVGSSVQLRWEGGWWAHKYDIYFGTASTPPLVVADYAPGSATAGVSSNKESYTVTNLQPGVVYYWRVVGKTMANGVRADGTPISRTVSGPTYSFTTSGGGAAIPPAPTALTAQAVAPTQVNLTWADVAGEEGFKVERKLSSSSTWAQIGTTSANDTTYADANSGLTAGTTYNYRVRAFTTAGNSGYSNIATVTTPLTTVSPGDVVLYASEAAVRVGSWSPVTDTSAAGGERLNNPNAGAARLDTPLASPAHYFEMSFTAQADQPYRLWMRGKAYNNSGYNDSVHAQFDKSVNSSGNPVYRIGTTSGTWVNLEEINGAGVNGWGWQDNGFGAGVLGPLLYFSHSGTQTIRVQVREDGFSIDQIVLSPDTFLNAAPGANKLDATKLPKQNGAPAPPPDPDAARVVADAYVRGGSYASTSFGASSELVVKKSTDGAYAREAYLKLDISAVQPGDTVRLRLNGWLSDTRAASVTTNVYAVTSTSWGETSLNWNNRPTSQSTVIGTIMVTGTTPQWEEVDLTNHVQAQRLAGATTIAIALKNPADTLPYVAFSSRESGNGPELLIQD